MTTQFATNFATLDWIIVAVYLSGSVAIGVMMNRYIHDVTHYMVGGRGSGTALNVATYIGTGLGLVTLMYASIEALAHGFAYVTLALIGAVVGAFLGGTGFVIGRLRSLNLLTIPEYFERRFNRRTRVVGGIICALAGILNMGLFPFAATAKFRKMPYPQDLLLVGQRAVSPLVRRAAGLRFRLATYE